MRLLLLATAAAITLPAAANAQAPLLWGSHSYNTYRKCTQPAEQDCQFPPAYAAPRTGGWFQAVDTDLTLASGSRAAAIVTHSKDALPVIRAASYAAPDERVNMNVMAIQGFRYSGAQSIDMAFKGSLHFVNSYDSGNPGEQSGEGILGFHYAIWSADRARSYDLANWWRGSAWSEGCGGAGVLARGYVGSEGLAGDHTLGFGLDTGCSGDKLTLNDGDEIYLVTALQSPSNRGGFVDAMSTLRVEYDYDKIVYTDTGVQVGAVALSQSLQNAVPEPASWAMMIGGFGLIGAATRRRKHSTAALA